MIEKKNDEKKQRNLKKYTIPNFYKRENIMKSIGVSYQDRFNDILGKQCVTC